MTTTATRSVTEETTKLGPSGKTDSRERTRRAAAVSVASDAAGTVKTLAEDTASRLPDIAAKGRSAFDDANRRIEMSSDEMVRLGTVLSFGFAAGLLIGGAPRILVGAALVPAAMLGLAVFDRTAAGRQPAVASKGAAGL